MAENENMTEDKGAEGQPAAKKKGSKLIIILIVALVLLIAGGGVLGFLMFAGGSADEANAPPEETLDVVPVDKDKKPPINIALEKFTANLRNDEEAGANAVAVAEFTFVVASEEMKAEVESRMPQIRHQVLRLLTSRSYEELNAPDGKELLCDDILVEVNRLLSPQAAAAYEMKAQTLAPRAMTGHDVATDTSGFHEGYAGAGARRRSEQLKALASSLPVQEVVYTNFILQKM